MAVHRVLLLFIFIVFVRAASFDFIASFGGGSNILGTIEFIFWPNYTKQKVSTSNLAAQKVGLEPVKD